LRANLAFHALPDDQGFPVFGFETSFLDEYIHDYECLHREKALMLLDANQFQRPQKDSVNRDCIKASLRRVFKFPLPY